MKHTKNWSIDGYKARNISICPNGGRPHLQGLVKRNDWETFRRSYRKCALAQCYARSIQHFATEDVFPIHSFLLLCGHFSLDEAFIELQLLVKATETCNVGRGAETYKEHFTFPFRS